MLDKMSNLYSHHRRVWFRRDYEVLHHEDQATHFLSTIAQVKKSPSYLGAQQVVL